MIRLAIRLVLVAALALQAWSIVRMTRYERAMGAGRDSFDNEEFDDALTSYEQARTLRNTDAEVWNWVGYAAASLVRDPPKEGYEPEVEADLIGEAWEAYVGAALRCPLDSWAWGGMAQVSLYEAERRDRREGIALETVERRAQGILDPAHAVALAAAKLAVQVEPSGYQGFDVLGRIHESTGNIEQARAAYVQSARMMPAPSFHTWGYGRRLQGGLYEAVLAGLDEGVARAPVFDRSLLLWEVGKFARAQGDLKTALARQQAAKEQSLGTNYTFQALVEMAGVLEELGRLPEAADALEQAGKLPFDRSAVAMRLGLIEARLERHDAACRHLRDALREMPTNIPLRIDTARSCKASGDVDTAEQVLRDSATSPVESLALSRTLLDFYVDQGRIRTAEALVKSWAREHPTQKEFDEWTRELARKAPEIEAQP